MATLLPGAVPDILEELRSVLEDPDAWIAGAMLRSSVARRDDIHQNCAR